DYNHNVWFFGAGDLPRWLGYSLGFDLVARYLSAHPEHRASTLTDASAEVFRNSI
ncbi:peptidase, partial [Escherichia coli]